jgi:integrase/recombinase XerD
VQLSHLLEEYVLFLRAGNRSQKTIVWYRAQINRFIQYLVDNGYSQDCSTITSRHIREYIAAIQPSYSANTVANSVRTLRILFAFGVRDELIDKDPAKRVPIPKIPRLDYTVFSPSDVDRLLATCNVKTLTGIRDFAIVMLLFDTGVRASELVGITDDDIDWERGLIKVFGKGAKDRSVPVSGRTLRAIRRYQIRRDRQFPTPRALFVSHKGFPLTDSGLRQLLDRLGGKTGLHVHPHKFRHSFAVNALRNDAREYDIQDCLGHTTLLMTKRYAQQSGDDLARRHKRFSPAETLKSRV